MCNDLRYSERCAQVYRQIPHHRDLYLYWLGYLPGFWSQSLLTPRNDSVLNGNLHDWENIWNSNFFYKCESVFAKVIVVSCFATVCQRSQQLLVMEGDTGPPSRPCWWFCSWAYSGLYFAQGGDIFLCSPKQLIKFLNVSSKERGRVREDLAKCLYLLTRVSSSVRGGGSIAPLGIGCIGLNDSERHR